MPSVRKRKKGNYFNIVLILQLVKQSKKTEVVDPNILKCIETYETHVKLAKIQRENYNNQVMNTNIFNSLRH